MIVKKAEIRYNKSKAGVLIQDENGYHFTYDEAYLKSLSAEPVSLTLPLRKETYSAQVLFPFFDGLNFIPVAPAIPDTNNKYGRM